jgi:hypothetical protein
MFLSESSSFSLSYSSSIKPPRMPASIQFDHEKLEVYQLDRASLGGTMNSVPSASRTNGGHYDHG